MIMHHLDAEGGFTCGDTETGLTCYAYPTSPSAEWARRHPAKAARDMLAGETGLWRTMLNSVASYDAANWAAMGVLA